jgi:hypothetical protein
MIKTLVGELLAPPPLYQLLPGATPRPSISRKFGMGFISLKTRAISLCHAETARRKLRPGCFVEVSSNHAFFVSVQ